MAIDTAARRSSAALVGLPFRFHQPALAGALDDSDRAAVAYLYAGFDYAADDGVPPARDQRARIFNLGRMMGR